MEYKLTKYNKYSRRKCLRCKAEITEGYEFKNIDLCQSCFNMLNRWIDPKYYTEEVLNNKLAEIKHQKQFFSAFKNKCDTLTVLRDLYKGNTSSSVGYKPMTAFKKENDAWTEAEETPLLMLDLKEICVIIFSETIRLISKDDDVMYDFNNLGFWVESMFIHTSETDITQGNEYICLCGEQIIKIGDEIKSQVIMARMLGLKNSRRIIINEKYSVKERVKHNPIKDYIYYYSFVQAFAERFKMHEFEMKDVAGSIYRVLYQTANKLNFDLDNNKSKFQDSESFENNLNDKDKLRADALRFFELSEHFTVKQLKKKRNEYLKKYHPDNAGTDMEKYSDYSYKTQMINIFYELLEKEVG